MSNLQLNPKFLTTPSYKIACLAVFCGSLLVQNTAFADPGRCALDFLNIPVGAQSAALGQASYAGITGSQAIFGNPALLESELNGFASYQSLLMDTKSQAAAVNLPFNTNSSLALGVNIFNPGEITGYDGQGAKTGKVNSGDYLVRAAYSSRRWIDFGVTVSYYEQRLDDVVGRGYGFGLGLARYFGQNRVGLTIDNIGPEFELGGASSPLPSKIALSGWIPVRSRFINLTADIVYGLESGFSPAGGLEYSPLEGFSVRAGSNIEVPISMGLGISGGSFDLDYSFVPSDEFGDRHWFSITFSR
jgi:hypothetical protein